MRVRGTTRRGAELLATIVRAVGMAIVAVLVLHILFTLLDANPANGLRTLVADLAVRLDLGLGDLFLPDDHKLRVALDFGVAAAAWWLITAVAVRLVRRLS